MHRWSSSAEHTRGSEDWCLKVPPEAPLKAEGHGLQDTGQDFVWFCAEPHVDPQTQGPEKPGAVCPANSSRNVCPPSQSPMLKLVLGL
jgi:hypothetical protein